MALRPKSPLLSDFEFLPPANILPLALRNSLDAYSARKLAGFTKQNKIEIVHAHMARDYPLAAYAAARTSGAKFVVTRHVLFPLNRLHKLTLARVARVIAVSEAVSLQLRSERIVSPSRIAVVKNGVDVDRFANNTFDSTRTRSAWGIPADALVVGTVGELKPLKGQEEFLRAAAVILKTYPNTYFVVAGIDSSNGKQNLDRLQQLSNHLNLQDRVRFVEWLPEIAQLYSAIDLFVSASRAESFGLAIAEAMASGTPVVATKTEGAKEIVEEGVTGLLVPIEDDDAIAAAVISLLNDRERSARIGSQAQEVVRSQFGIERMINSTEEIYRQALE